VTGDEKPSDFVWNDSQRHDDVVTGGDYPGKSLYLPLIAQPILLFSPPSQQMGPEDRAGGRRGFGGYAPSGVQGAELGVWGEAPHQKLEY